MGDLQDDLNRLPSSSGFAEIRVMLDHAKKTDIISNTGPYMAEVLRATVRTNPPQGMGADLVKVRWITVYARILDDKLRNQPPIHSILPIPTNMGTVEEVGVNSYSDRAIRLHHEFLGFKTDLPIPSPGDKIWVNFLNKNNGELKNPVYLAPVMQNQEKHLEKIPQQEK